jgi:HD-like signal output (HDOD) protein
MSNLFNEVRSVRQSLCHTFREQETTTNHTNLKNELTILAKTVLGVVAEDQDAALATLLLKSYHFGYYANHSVDSAIVSAILAKALSWKKEKATTLVMATLTMNIGMAALQDRLFFHQGALSSEDKEAIENHPKKSMLLLKKIGLSNPDLLNAVMFHHEKHNGSGYPEKLQGNDIPELARVIALADIFCAMIGSRSYRKGMEPDKVMHGLFTKHKAFFDNKLPKLLVQQIGMHLPAKIIEIAGNEKLMIVRHKQKKYRCANQANQQFSIINNSEITKIIDFDYDHDIQAKFHHYWNQDSSTPTLFTEGVKPHKTEIETARSAIKGIQIPPVPEVLDRIKAEMRQAKPNVDKISTLVGQDPVISGILLSAVNTPLCGLSEKVSSIQHAIMVLGLERFSAIVLSAALKLSMKNTGMNNETFDRIQQVSFCARRIATQVHGADPEAAYLSGLFHSCGAILLNMKHPEYLNEFQTNLSDQPAVALIEEENYLGTNHATLNFLIASEWQLPEKICLSVYHQNNPNIAKIPDAEIRSTVAILTLATWTDDWVASGKTTPNTELSVIRDQALNELMISLDDIHEIRQDIEEQLEM